MGLIGWLHAKLGSLERQTQVALNISTSLVKRVGDVETRLNAKVAVLGGFAAHINTGSKIKYAKEPLRSAAE